MPKRAYSVNGFSPLIARGPHPFHPVYKTGSGSRLRTIQAQVDYTPNLAQEINLSRFQRRINVDRVSISVVPRDKMAERGPRSVYGERLGSTERKMTFCKSQAEKEGVRPRPSSEKARCVASMAPKHTLRSLRRNTNADSYSRCFRYLDCFRKDAVDPYSHLSGRGMER